MGAVQGEQTPVEGAEHQQITDEACQLAIMDSGLLAVFLQLNHAVLPLNLS